MKRSVVGHIAVGIVLFTIANLIPQASWACGGTFRPVCGRTAWLAKFVSSSIVLPGSGAAITVPVGLVPYVLWSPSATCAQPASPTTLELTLTCTAAGGGSPIIIGPTAVPTPVPTTPGAQTVGTGAGGSQVFGGPFQFPISGGTLPVGASYSCLVEGAYSVNFTGGTGAGGNATGSGIMTGIGDTEVCIVEELPGNPGVPRLDFRHIESDDGLFFRMVRRGDHADNKYLVANNDLDESVSLNIVSTTSQVARTPMGSDPGGTFFALSNPVAGTDDFIQSLAQDLPPGGLIPLPDPNDPNPGLSFDRVLGPHELQQFTIITRPNGMCADGSCSEALVKGTGLFGNGDHALGCAGTAIVVDDVPAVSHQCEITDTLQVSHTAEGQWLRATFNDDPHMTTHYAGNLDPSFGPPATQTTGDIPAGLFNKVGYPPMSTDYLRTEQALESIRWGVDGFDDDLGYVRQHMDVNVFNLPTDDWSIRVPLVARDGVQSDLSLDLDAGTDLATVRDSMSQQMLFEGPFTNLLNTPPGGLSVDHETFREITKTGIPSQPLLGTEPLSHSALHAPTDPFQRASFRVLDPRTRQPIAWNASSDNTRVQLIRTSGSASQDLEVFFNPPTLAIAPDLTLAHVEVSNPQTLNKVIYLPIAVRNSPNRRCRMSDLPPRRLTFQPGGSGFTPQTWSVPGNQANFFVRDPGYNSQVAGNLCNPQ